MSIGANVLSVKRGGSKDYYEDAIWVIKRLRAHLLRNRYKESRANALMLSYLGFIKEVGEEILRRILEKKDEKGAYRMFPVVSEFANISLEHERYYLSEEMNEKKKQRFLEVLIARVIQEINEHFKTLSGYADKVYDFDLDIFFNHPEKMPELWAEYNRYCRLTLTPVLCPSYSIGYALSEILPVATLEEAERIMKTDYTKKLMYACIGHRKDDGKADFLHISEFPEYVIPCSGKLPITWDGSREYHLCRPEV